MKKKIKFVLNSDIVEVDINPATVVLDFVRIQKLTGTKEGCKEGDCGACTVLVGDFDTEGKIKYRPINSCLLPVQNISGKHVVTIEGINCEGKSLTPVQSAFVEEGASQCGFCTPGFIISLTGYLLNGNSNSTSVIDSLDGNICRCTGHNSIIRAAEKISARFEKEKIIDINFLIKEKVIPEYFKKVKTMLKDVQTEKERNISSVSEDFYYVSSGTDLFVQKPELMLKSNVRFLEEKSELHFIKSVNGFCHVGSLSTVTELLESKVINKIFPSIAEFAELFGSTPIRNSATVGGNIVNASPIGDMTSLFMALDSTLVLSDGSSEREVPLKNFYKGYKVTVKKPDEYVYEVKFPLPKGEYYFNFEKVSKRTYLDIATVNSAMLTTVSDDIISSIHISAGGVYATPLYLKNTSSFLKGKEISAENLNVAVELAQNEISPISDARGSAGYKRLLLTRLIYAHFIELFPEKINVEMSL